MNNNGSTHNPWYNGEGTTESGEGQEMRKAGSGQKNVLNDQQKFKLWNALREIEKELQAECPSFREVARRLTVQLQFKVTQNNISNAVDHKIVVWKPKLPPRALRKAFNIKVKEAIEDIRNRIDNLERFGVPVHSDAIEQQLSVLSDRLEALEKQGAALSKVVFNICEGLGLPPEGKEATVAEKPVEKPVVAPPSPPEPPTPPPAPLPVPVTPPMPQVPDVVPLEKLFEHKEEVETIPNPVLSTDPDWDWVAYRQLERKLGGNSRPLLRALQQPINDPQGSVPGNIAPSLTWRSSNYAIYVIVCQRNEQWCWSVGVRHLTSKDIERKFRSRKTALQVFYKCERTAQRYLISAGEGAYRKVVVGGSVILYKSMTADEIAFLGRTPPSQKKK